MLGKTDSILGWRVWKGLGVGLRTCGQSSSHMPAALSDEVDSVPVSRLPDLVFETKQDIEEVGLVSTIVGHVGDG